MKLTLHVLLAYLDDTLEPAQAKIIGQRIAESEQAQKLIERIQQVTRRRRLTTPEQGGAKMDANTIAEYLDRSLDAEQGGEVEQIAMASDVNLAELAACHQLLTLVLGEPIEIPPSSYQKMYRLVQGPESNPKHRPPRLRERIEDDDTIVPTSRAKFQPWMLWTGGGVLTSILLAVVLWQVLQGGSELPVGPGPNGDLHAQLPPMKPEPKEEPKGDLKPMAPVLPEPKIEPPVLPEPKVDAEVKKPEPPATKKEEVPFLDPPKLDFLNVPVMPFAPPENQPVNLGQYRLPGPKEVSIVLQATPGQEDWKRLGGTMVDVPAGHRYVGLPGCRGDLELKKGVQMTLWGNLPELIPHLPIWESVVDLHSSSSVDADYTHRRGRVLLTGTKDGSATVRIRFENPSQSGAMEYADVVLQSRGTELIVDRWSYLPPGEPFFKDPKDPRRQGPIAMMGFAVRSGSVQLKIGDASYTLFPPPGNALALWSSGKGLGAPQQLKSLPEPFLDNPPPPMGMDKKYRDDKLKARDDLVLFFNKAAKPDIALASLDDDTVPARREMGVYCAGALDYLPMVVKDLNRSHREVRQAAIRELSHWISQSRDNVYEAERVIAQVRNNPRIAERILELFHGGTNLDLLVEHLANSELVIREMAHMNLMAQVPAGRTIAFDATWDGPSLLKAQTEWRKAILTKMAPVK